MSGGADDIVLDKDALARFMSKIKDPEEKERVRETAEKVPVKKINRAPRKKKVVQSWKKNMPKPQQRKKKVVQKPKPAKVQFTAMYIKKGGRGRKTFTFEATDNITIAKLKTVIGSGLGNAIKSEHMMLTLYDIPLTHGTLKDCGIQDETCLFITDVRTNYTNELDALAGMMREKKSQPPKQARMERNVADALTGFLGNSYSSAQKSSTKKKKREPKTQTTSKTTPKTTSKTSRESPSYGLSLTAQKPATGPSTKSSDKAVRGGQLVNDGQSVDYDKFGSQHLKKLLKDRGIIVKTWDRNVLIQSLEEDDAKTAELAITSRDTAKSVNPSPPATPKVPPPGIKPMILSNSKSAEKKEYNKPVGKITPKQNKKSKKPKKGSGSGKTINMPYKSGPTGKSRSSKVKGNKAKKVKASLFNEEKVEKAEDKSDTKQEEMMPPARPPPLPVDTKPPVAAKAKPSKKSQNKPEKKEAEQKPKKPSKQTPAPANQIAGPPMFVLPGTPTTGPPSGSQLGETQSVGPPPPPTQAMGSPAVRTAPPTPAAGNAGAPPPLPKHIQERLSNITVGSSPSVKKPEKKEQETLSRPKTKGPRGAKKKKSTKESHIIVQLGIGKSASVEDMVFNGQVHGSAVRKRAAEKLGVDSSKIKLNRANLPIWDTDYLNDGDHITVVVEKAKKERISSKPKTETVARADLVRMWDNKASNSRARDDEKDIPDGEYGMPKKNTETWNRMLKAKAWSAKKLEQLYVEFPKIPNVKILPDGTMTATFGDIFEHYQHIDTVIVGTLQSAKKKKLASFDNKRSFPLLQQRYDDHVVVTLFARQ